MSASGQIRSCSEATEGPLASSIQTKASGPLGATSDPVSQQSNDWNSRYVPLEGRACRDRSVPAFEVLKILAGSGPARDSVEPGRPLGYRGKRIAGNILCLPELVVQNPRRRTRA